MIKAIAVDDEPIALDIIIDHAKKVQFIELTATFLSATEALNYVVREQIQLIFLDIRMPDLSGLEFAKLIGEKAQIIFTTAYSEHALNGFDLAAIDYLLKPIDFARFLQACHLAQKRVVIEPLSISRPNKEIFVKSGYDWVRINIDNLLYAQGQDNYVCLYETDKHTLTRLTFNELLLKLPSNQFIRVDKSYIVAISKIDKMERHQLTIAGDKIPISQPYRNAILQALNK